MPDYQCKKCGMLFKAVGNLREHRRTHGERRVECWEPECDKRFATEKDMKRHLKLHSGETFKCEQCGKAYKSRTALRAHEKTHFEEESFICQQCGASFNTSEPYKIHLRKHAQIRPYSCSKCRKTFLSRGVCRRHVRTHHTAEEEMTSRAVVPK